MMCLAGMETEVVCAVGCHSELDGLRLWAVGSCLDLHSAPNGVGAYRSLRAKHGSSIGERAASDCKENTSYPSLIQFRTFSA